MPYCLSCGYLRETIDGWCKQCRDDELIRKNPGMAARLEEKESDNNQDEDEELLI